MPIVCSENIAIRKTSELAQSRTSGRLRRRVTRLLRRPTRWASRGTASRAVRNANRYSAPPTTTSDRVVARRACWRSGEFLICGDTTKLSSGIVAADPIDRALANFERSTGSCVIAAARDPYGMLTRL